MNCQDVNYLLDGHAPEELTQAQRETIDVHLASCHACGEEWVNLREVAALPVPAMSADLRERIAAVLPARHAAQARRAFRPYVVGGVLLVGAALAAAFALRFAERGLESVPAPVGESQAAVPGFVEAAAPESLIASGQSSKEVAAVADSASSGDAAKRAATNVPLDPHRILVLKRPETTADAPALALAERCYDALFAELRTLGGIKVVTDAAVYTSASYGDTFTLSERDRKIARGLGAGKVVTVTSEMGCEAALYDSQTGVRDQGAGGGGVNSEGDRAERFGKAFAHAMREKVLMIDGPTLLVEARATVLDTARSDVDRVTALLKPQSLGPPNSTERRNFLDKEVIAAAAQIATKSTDARVREVIWSTLRDVDDPVMVQPLLQALTGDPERSVRYQVVFALHHFLGQPGVLEALQRAAAEDPDHEPEFPTGMTVREAALRASIADKDFRNWARSTLFDESLPPRWRLLNLYGSTDGRFATVANIGPDAGNVVFDIGRREKDAHVRALAWNVLRMASPDEARVPVLLGDLASHPDEGVRANAAWVLEQHVGMPEVRAALDRAVDDPSIEVRRRVTSAIAKGAN